MSAIEYLDEAMKNISHLVIDPDGREGDLLTVVLSPDDVMDDGLLHEHHLEHVLDYIDHKDWTIVPPTDYNKIVLRLGGFIGEYIRDRSTDKSWHWIAAGTAYALTSHDFFKVNILANLRLLYNEVTGKFLYPLAELLDYIKNPKQHSLRQFIKNSILA
ncbi:MAG: hypothetical protein GY810_30010 [Aureispira sp.]|nr:hypothetical protein [Aureispira sp.]